MIDDGCSVAALSVLIFVVALYFGSHNGCQLPPKTEVATKAPDSPPEPKETWPLFVGVYVLIAAVVGLVLAEESSATDTAIVARSLLWPLLLVSSLFREIPKILRGR